MALAYLQIFADKAELLEPFDDAERGRLLSAMLSYALHDVEPVLTGNERYIWPVFRQMIDQSKAALQSKQAGGRARQATRQTAESSSDQQTEAEAQQTAAENSSVQQEPADCQQTEAEAPIIQESRIKIQDSRFKKQEGVKRTRFAPPTVDDVSAYAVQAGLALDAQRFVDFYASKGWRVGSAPMKDWKAAARNWAARDKSPPSVTRAPKSVEQQQYTQREYQHTDSAVDAMMAEFQRGEGSYA